MKYAPGSFSKNFAWHGTGLRKLHQAIRSGFHRALVPVDREKWRADSGINDAALDLIPINFFLHNLKGRLSVDELVLQAVERPHTLRFDRLALFAFHLNQVGKPPRKGPGRPAMWANEFVREKLWKNGVWVASALGETSLDSFISDRMAAAGAQTKCRTNYRHLFELCEYLPANLPSINSGAEQWISSALPLAWDRFILDGGAFKKSALLDLISKDELHKLMGVTEEFALLQADSAVDLYIEADGLSRFTSSSPPIIFDERVSSAESSDQGTDSDWLDQEESDSVVERHTVEVQQQKRDRKAAAKLKLHYNHTCMICEVKLQIAEKQFYSEAAHIRPLGKPHDGPDKRGNMLVLCPNHHLQFDRGIFRLRGSKGNYVIASEIVGDPLSGKKIALKHELDDDCVDWHRRWFKINR